MEIVYVEVNVKKKTREPPNQADIFDIIKSIKKNKCLWRNSRYSTEVIRDIEEKLRWNEEKSPSGCQELYRDQYI